MCCCSHFCPKHGLGSVNVTVNETENIRLSVHIMPFIKVLLDSVYIEIVSSLQHSMLSESCFDPPIWKPLRKWSLSWTCIVRWVTRMLLDENCVWTIFLPFYFLPIWAIKPLISAFDVALHCLAELQEIEKENQGSVSKMEKTRMRVTWSPSGFSGTQHTEMNKPCMTWGSSFSQWGRREGSKKEKNRNDLKYIYLDCKEFTLQLAMNFIFLSGNTNFTELNKTYLINPTSSYLYRLKKTRT